MAVDDIVTLRVVGRYQQQNIVNVLHYEITAQTSSEQEVLFELCDAFSSSLGSDWVGSHIDSYEFVGLKAFNHTGDAKTPGFSTVESPGTVVGEEVPSSVCRTITLYTASSNFRRRGRLMLSGGATTMFNIDDGSVTSTEITSLTALGTSLMASLDGGGNSFSLCLPPTALLPKETIIDAIGRTTPANIRSRRIRQFLIG